MNQPDNFSENSWEKFNASEKIDNDFFMFSAAKEIVYSPVILNQRNI